VVAPHTTLSADILLGRWCGDPSGQPTAAPCSSICNRTKKAVTGRLMWPSSTTDLHLRARLAQGTGRDVLRYSQILTVEFQVYFQVSHVKFLADSVALLASYVRKFRFSLLSFHQCSTFVLWPPRLWTICVLEQLNTEIWLLVERPEFEKSRRKKIFSSSLCPEWLWCPASLVFSGYRSSFPSMILTTHSHLMSSLRRMSGVMPLLHLYNIMLWTETALPFFFCSLQIHAKKSHTLLGMRCSVILLRLSKEISRNCNNCHLSWQFVSVLKWPRLKGASTK
jgi:hypothetical protein